MQGSSNSGPQAGTSRLITGGISLGIKCTINGMHLNHPQTILPTRSREKLSSVKLVPKRSGTADLMDPSLIIPDSL